MEDLSDTWGEELFSLEKENLGDFEKKSTSDKLLINASIVLENDSSNSKKMEFEPLLEALGECNLRSNKLTHGVYPCHCLAQTCGIQRSPTSA